MPLYVYNLFLQIYNLPIYLYKAHKKLLQVSEEQKWLYFLF